MKYFEGFILGVILTGVFFIAMYLEAFHEGIMHTYPNGLTCFMP